VTSAGTADITAVQCRTSWAADCRAGCHALLDRAPDITAVAALPDILAA